MIPVTPSRLYLMQVGIMPEYKIPVTCYLVQMSDGKNILIDTGLPQVIPEDSKEFENGKDVIQQLAELGLTPDDIDLVISTHYDGDHAGRHGSFIKAQYVVQRVQHEDAFSNPRFATIRAEWDQPAERIQLVDGDTELFSGFTLLDTTGHVPGHQSVLLQLPQTGPVLLMIDAVPFAEWFTRDRADAKDDPHFADIQKSTSKLMDIIDQKEIKLVIFGHDPEQWQTLKKVPEFYE